MKNLIKMWAKNKKGNVMIQLFIFMFLALLFAIFLGLAVFGFNLVNDTLGQDVDIGNVNLKNVTDTTFGQINTGLINNADTIGIIALFGMVFLMILNGYFFGSKKPKLFFIVDVFLLVLFFIPSIYISQVYETFINSTSLFSSTYIDIIPKTSKFLLNLPVIIAIVGVLTMILSYAGLDKIDRSKDLNIPGT